MSIFPTRILLATDGSEEATFAARTAVDLAKKTSSELHVVRVWPIVQPAQIEQEARTLLNEQVEEIKAAGGAIAQAHLRMGGAAEEIVKLSEEIGASLVVIGSRGLGGMRRARMGSVSKSVVRHSHCPVFGGT